MATTETFGIARAETNSRPATQGLVANLRTIIDTAIRRAQDRRALVRISRLDPHIIHDMGFDPEAIYAALDGSWDGIDLKRLERR